MSGDRDGSDGAKDGSGCPQPNAPCERLIGTTRPDCRDWRLGLNDQHFVSSCGSGSFTIITADHTPITADHTPVSVPAFPTCASTRSQVKSRHRVPAGHRVIAAPVLAGLHHE